MSLFPQISFNIGAAEALAKSADNMPSNVSINPGAADSFFSKLLTLSNLSKVTPDSANALPACFYCVDKISSFIASNPHLIYEKTTHGRVDAKKHDQYKLIKKRPNPYTNQYVFTKTLVTFMLLWGDGLAHIKRNESGRPVAYYVWHPKNVQIKMIDGVLWYKNFRTKENIPYSDMIHVCDTVRDPYSFKGKSRISIAHQVFQEAQSYNDFKKKFIQNGTHLGYGITYPQKVDQAQADLVEEKLNKKKAGIHQGGNNIVLGGMAKIEKLGLPLKDAQMLETLEKHGTDIGMIFGFKPGQIGGKTGESFNSLEQYNIEFLQYPILPIAKAYMQEFDEKIFRSSEEETHCMEIDFNALLQGSIKDRVQLYKALKPAITLNQILSREGINTFDGGDVRIADLNTTTLHNILKIDPNQSKKVRKLIKLFKKQIKKSKKQAA